MECSDCLIVQIQLEQLCITQVQLTPVALVKGKSWVVVKNWEGKCPRVAFPGETTNVYNINQNYTFVIPDDFPSGQRVIFAWYNAVCWLWKYVLMPCAGLG